MSREYFDRYQFFIENGFNEYIKDYNRNLNKEDINFIDQFYLANLSDRQIVKNIYTKNAYVKII